MRSPLRMIEAVVCAVLAVAVLALLSMRAS